MAEYSLDRFKKAQSSDYPLALEEIKEGRKRSHWIWYIFPQLKGLGFSGMSDYYGIRDLGEAKAYLADPMLKTRLLEICNALLIHRNKSAAEIFGYPDNMKVRSCMTLFFLAAPQEKTFKTVLDVFYDGKKDQKTLTLLGTSREEPGEDTD